MAIKEPELEMALESEFGGDFEGEFEVPSSDDTASSSAAASQRASRELYAKYRTACKGRSIFKRLTKTKLSPIDESIMLQKRIDGLPQLFTDLAELKRRAPKMSDQDYRDQRARLMARLGYLPDIYLGRLDQALAQARCELSWSNWRFIASCDGMEVDNPQHVSAQTADHYARTVLREELSNLKVSCKDGGGLCDVDYPNGITIRVDFSKVPDSLVAVQVAPKKGPLREFTYSCFRGTLNLRQEETPLT
jgi:hypothetical protein